MKLVAKKQQEVAFVVVREHYDPNTGEPVKTVPVAIFMNYEDAVETAGAHTQKFIDEGIEGFRFDVATTAFYD